MLLPSLSLDELRQRVREAEALLRVARQHARDAHDDPMQSEHASARIQSICHEVAALFPGLHEPTAPDPVVAEALAALKAAVHPTAETGDDDGDTGQEDAEDEDGEDGDAEDDEDGEWDIDYEKLASAIENEALMSRFPEPGRSAFKRAAQYLVEAHERQELFGRVIEGFGEVSELAKQNVEDLRQKLAMALTLEQLASKNKA